MSSKESKAAAAKEKYNNNKEAEQRRKFLYRIKQGNVYIYRTGGFPIR